jgi:hypothetical protein
MYTLRQSAVMCWGKIRRAFLVAFRRRKVLAKLERRRGACTRCGACCKILFQCPAYDDSDGNPKCLIYNDRPGVCGLFPLDEKDLRDRDIVMPDRKCGFYFDEGPATGSRGISMPIRWGPPRISGGRPKILRSTLAILWLYLRRGRPNGNGNGNGHGNGHGNGRHGAGR